MAGRAFRVGSREIVAEQTPLRVRFGGVHFPFTLSQSEQGPLRLLPHRGVRVLGWVLCALGWPVLLLGLLAIRGLAIEPTRENLVAVLFLFAWGLPCTFFGVVLLGPRYRFDAGASELTIRHFGRTRRRSLADVLAVQVIDAGHFGESDDSRGFRSYQLNLILDDPGQLRLFVAYNSDKVDVGAKANRLAEFLNVPLLTGTGTAEEVEHDCTGGPSDPTRLWAKSYEPLPPFDLETGVLGRLSFGDRLEQAAFLGRPDRVEQAAHWLELQYLPRGFGLEFHPDGFMELTCFIAPPAEQPPKPGQGFARPRLSGALELTPETSAAEVRKCLGAPESDEDHQWDKVLIYARGGYSMVFEFEQSTGRLLTWTATRKR